MGRYLAATAIFALVGACATASGATSSSASSQSAVRGDQCFSARQVNSFRPAGRDAVDVEISRSRVYRLSLGAGCFDVDWASAVALRSRGGSPFICSANDAELIVPSSIGTERCQVTGVRQLSDEEIRAR